MIYGMYLSATGIIANSHRQDVIANNLANSETVGFKRDLALFQERQTESREQHGARQGDPLLEGVGGGLYLSPTAIDTKQGELEHTGAPLDVAIEGNGYFAVQDKGKTSLTRNGRFMVDRQGNLVLADEQGHKVLGANGQPIRIVDNAPVYVNPDGGISQSGREVAQIGVFNVSKPGKLVKEGATLFSYADQKDIQPITTAQVKGEFVERANVDPTTELAELMDTQRQLEANANMIRYQDSTLQRLVNDVGKIS